MKLVDILGKYLEVWPNRVNAIVQDPDRRVYANTNSGGDLSKVVFDDPENGVADDWYNVCYVSGITDVDIDHILAEDYSTAVVTKEMWQEVRNTYLNVKETQKVSEEFKVGDKVTSAKPDKPNTILALFKLNDDDCAVITWGEYDAEMVDLSTLTKYKSPEDIQQETKQAHIKRIKEWLEYSNETLEHGLNMAYDAGYEQEVLK